MLRACALITTCCAVTVALLIAGPQQGPAPTSNLAKAHNCDHRHGKPLRYSKKKGRCVPIDPRHQPVTAEARLADRLAELERRVRMLERGSLNQVVRNRKYAEVLGEVSTALTSPTDLGGPSVTIDVPAGSFVAVYAEVDIHTSGAGTATASLFEPTDFPSGQSILQSGSAIYNTMKTNPGSVVGGTLVGGQILFVPTAGQRTYSLRYSQSGGGTGSFQNRKLWIEVF